MSTEEIKKPAKLKHFLKNLIKYGHHLDKPAKAILLIPGLRVVGLVLMGIDAIFDMAWAAEQKEKVNHKIIKAKEK